MQLRNIQQQTTKHVEVYYEHLLKLTNYLHVRTTYVFLTTIFKACLLPYLRLTTTSMKKDTLIEHKEVVVCEENGPVSLSYNALLTTPEANIIVKLVVPIVITKSALTYTNCDKIGHLVKTCHNKKIMVPGVLIATVKSTKLGTRTKTQLVNLGRIPVCYPYIVCFSE
jgi:hypothetical protein